MQCRIFIKVDGAYYQTIFIAWIYFKIMFFIYIKDGHGAEGLVGDGGGGGHSGSGGGHLKRQEGLQIGGGGDIHYCQPYWIPLPI